MRISRFYLPRPLHDGALLELTEDAAHHAVKVLRLREGQPLRVFDGEGREHEASVAAVAGRRVEVRLGRALAPARESPLRTVLVQGVSSGDRMDFTLQKAVELGVSAVQPVLAARSVVKLDADRAQKRLAHWRQVVVSACEQSGRATVPEVAPVMALPDWLAQAAGNGRLKLLLAPGAAARFADLPPPALPVELLIGPEGGLSPDEETAAAAAGFSAVQLGPRVLRTETAALAALAAMQALWGDF